MSHLLILSHHILKALDFFLHWWGLLSLGQILKHILKFLSLVLLVFLLLGDLFSLDLTLTLLFLIDGPLLCKTLVFDSLALFIFNFLLLLLDLALLVFGKLLDRGLRGSLNNGFEFLHAFWPGAL